MASTDPEVKSSSTPPPPGGVDYFKVDVILRFLLLAASVVALAVIVSSDQTVQVPFQNLLVPQPTKFKYSPAFVYFVAAFSVSGLYALVSALASLSVIQKPEFKQKFLLQLHFLFWDALILGITASATGAAGSVAYIGLKGNSHVGWIKVCNVYDKFCRHLAGSIAVALFGTIVTVLLIWLSAFSIHSRVPK